MMSCRTDWLTLRKDRLRSAYRKQSSGVEPSGTVKAMACSQLLTCHQPWTSVSFSSLEASRESIRTTPPLTRGCLCCSTFCFHTRLRNSSRGLFQALMFPAVKEGTDQGDDKECCHFVVASSVDAVLCSNTQTGKFHKRRR